MDKYIDSDGIAHFVGHDYDGAILADKILRRLKFDNETIRAVTHLVRMHDTRYGELGRSVKARTIRRALNRIEPQYFNLLTLLQEADLHAQNPALMTEKLSQLHQARKKAEEILAAGECISLKELALNGSDLIKAGIKPGPDIGAWLDRLLNYVIEYPEKNNREELLFMLNTWREEPPQKKDLQSFR